MRRDKAIAYFNLAKYQADTFSKDPSTKVGCIVLAPDSLQILTMGYNGMPRGIDETRPERWERPTKYQYVEHAERNALYNACRHGTPLQGSIAVVTLFPCVDCCRGLIQSGIQTVVSVTPDESHERWGRDFTRSLDMLREANVNLILLTDEEALISDTPPASPPVRAL